MELLDIVPLLEFALLFEMMCKSSQSLELMLECFLLLESEEFVHLLDVCLLFEIVCKVPNLRSVSYYSVIPICSSWCFKYS